jgi:hypothetical protein
MELAENSERMFSVNEYCHSGARAKRANPESRDAIGVAGFRVCARRRIPE